MLHLTGVIITHSEQYQIKLSCIIKYEMTKLSYYYKIQSGITSAVKSVYDSRYDKFREINVIDVGNLCNIFAILVP